MTNKLLFLLIGLILFAGCNNDSNGANYVVTVTITEEEWSHWWETEDEFPDPIITTAQMQRGDLINLDNWSTITVLDIRDDYVVIGIDGWAFPAISWPERYEQRIFEITYGDRFVLDNGTESTITFWFVVFEKASIYDQP